jgi:hypothetical protein
VDEVGSHISFSKDEQRVWFSSSLWPSNLPKPWISYNHHARFHELICALCHYHTRKLIHYRNISLSCISFQLDDSVCIQFEGLLPVSINIIVVSSFIYISTLINFVV